MKKWESCVINGGKTTPYFKLERGTRQGDPISAYLFIITLEVPFSLIKANPDIEDLQFFSHTFLYSAYADGTTFFSKKRESQRLINFLFFLDLKLIMQSAKLLALVSKKGLRWHSVEWITLI